MNTRPPILHHALESMPDAEALQAEDALWWVIGRKAIIREYLRRASQSKTISKIMDIGCGSGGNLDVLAEFGKVVGVEPSETLARRARSRGIADAVYEQDVQELDECRNIDLFTMFDVLEHIENERDFLAQLHKNAPHEHYVLISVPACPFLFGHHDRMLHHYRRYTSKTLTSTLEESGYKVQRLSYFLFFLFPLVLVKRMKDKLVSRLSKKEPGFDYGELPPVLAVPFATALRAEALLSRAIRFPIGLWLFALAEG